MLRVQYKFRFQSRPTRSQAVVLETLERVQDRTDHPRKDLSRHLSQEQNRRSLRSLLKFGVVCSVLSNTTSQSIQATSMTTPMEQHANSNPAEREAAGVPQRKKLQVRTDRSGSRRRSRPASSLLVRRAWALRTTIAPLDICRSTVLVHSNDFRMACCCFSNTKRLIFWCGCRSLQRSSCILSSVILDPLACIERSFCSCVHNGQSQLGNQVSQHVP